MALELCLVPVARRLVTETFTQGSLMDPRTLLAFSGGQQSY
uniref:Alternative protein HMGCR n=1 Tax=Homo sapiens TaxID=9606 RepID=L8E6X7_HUMAN|nr:alternative protein HMGCR [Homo sapiens]